MMKDISGLEPYVKTWQTWYSRGILFLWCRGWVQTVSFTCCTSYASNVFLLTIQPDFQPIFLALNPVLRPDKPDIVVVFCFYDVEDGSKCLNTVNKILEAWTSHTLTSLILCKAADPIFGQVWIRIQFFFGYQIRIQNDTQIQKHQSKTIMSKNFIFKHWFLEKFGSGSSMVGSKKNFYRQLLSYS